MFGNLGTYLCGIAINCLASRDNQVIFQIADGACQRLGSRPCIRTAEYAVRNKDSFVRAHCHSLAEHFLRLRKPHGNYGYFCAVLVF